MNKTAIRLVSAVIVAALAFAATSVTQGTRLAISLIVAVPSFVLMVISRIQLGGSFSVRPESRALVTTGLYSRIEHPMYVFLDMFLLAVIVAVDLPILLPVWCVLVLIQMLQARREEKVLAAAFDAAYEAYRARTWF